MQRLEERKVFEVELVYIWPENFESIFSDLWFKCKPRITLFVLTAKKRVVCYFTKKHFFTMLCLTHANPVLILTKFSAG